MFFEGSEKKATLTIDPTKISLLTDFTDDFWQQLVEQCQAKILSRIKNQYCTAYLLSESSLFVWDDHFVILTCGETSLINAIEFFIQQVNPQDIVQLIFQRKNEYFAHAQPSSFLDDIKILQQHFRGRAARFGALDSHHNYLYHLDTVPAPGLSQASYELLAYQISPHASSILCKQGLDSSQVRQFLRLEQLLPGFTLDDFVFEPYGYSLNAIDGTKYLTIHITPQENSSYVSVETNLNLLTMTPLLLEILQPASFDLIAFNEPEFNALNRHYIPGYYLSKELVESTLSSNELVSFANYIRPTQTVSQPHKIDISGHSCTI